MNLRAIACATLVSALAAASPAIGQGALIIDGATVHTLAGEPFVGTVLVQDGRIAAVGAEIPTPDGASRIDASGLHLYPGLMDPISQLGLTEVGAVAATVDTTELGSYNPHLAAATAIHPPSELLPVARANGITHSLVAPQIGNDGVIAGQASLVHLDGWTVEEMAIEPAAALAVRWPAIQTRTFDFATFSIKTAPFREAKEKAEEVRGELADWLDAARHYAQAKAAGSSRLERNLELEALSRALDGGMPVLVQANAKRDIEAAVKFMERQGLEMILVGGRDAWQVKEMLAEKGIPVILGFPQSLPAEEDHPYDQPMRAPGELVEAGIKIAFASGAGGGFGPGGPHASRTLPFEAAAAVAFGLDRDEAIRALTINGAEILGFGDRLGTIEAGKIANLMITDGDPLEATTQVRHLVIAGREVSTDNRHRQLYERYRARP